MNKELSLLFKKYVKMVVPTVLFAIFLLYLLYFIEIILEYDYSSLINEFPIVWTSQLFFVEAEMAGTQLSTLLNQHMVHNRISAIPASTKNIWLVQFD